MDHELIEYLDRRFAELRAELRADIAASAEDIRGYIAATGRRSGDQEPGEDLNRSPDGSRTPIGDETAKLCAHIQAFGERLKPGRFLRYLEARAAEVADRGGSEPGLGAKRSVVYAVPRFDRDQATR